MSISSILPYSSLKDTLLCTFFKISNVKKYMCVYIYYVCRLVMSNSATPWIVTCQAPLFMELSRQEFWNGLPSPSPGGLPNPGIELRSPALQADSFNI